MQEVTHVEEEYGKDRGKDRQHYLELQSVAKKASHFSAGRMSNLEF